MHDFIKRAVAGILCACAVIWLQACTVPAPPAPPDRTNPLDTVALGYTPEPPFGLSATTCSDTAVELTWYDKALAELRYYVSRKNKDTGTVFDTLATLPPHSTSYTDRAIPPTGNHFTYAVTVVGRSGIATSAFVDVTFYYRSVAPRRSPVDARGIPSGIHTIRSGNSRLQNPGDVGGILR